MDRTLRALTDLCAFDDRLSGREAIIDEPVLALEERRAALRKTIPGLFLAAYDALGRQGRRPILVPVRRAHCGGCYLRLPPQLYSSIRRRQSLYPCPHCGRLLYSSPRAEESEATSESERRLGDHPETTGRAAKRVRRIPGRQPARQEPNAARRRERQGKDSDPAGNARRRNERRGKRRTDSVRGPAKPIERSL